MSAREAIPEDFDSDPSFKRQRHAARYLLGIALNRYPEQPPVRLMRMQEFSRKALVDIALREGLVAYDDYHHAPMCLANNWGRKQLPEGPCTCGAERHKIMTAR